MYDATSKSTTGGLIAGSVGGLAYSPISSMNSSIGVNPTKVSSEIESEFSVLDSQMSDLQRIIIILNERLSPILVQFPETGNEKDSSSPMRNSPLAQSLQGLNSSLKNRIDSIGGIIDRIQL